MAGQRAALESARAVEASAPPEMLGPMQVNSIDGPRSSLQPLHLDLEVIGDGNAALRQRRVAQGEVRVRLLRNTGRIDRYLKRSFVLLSSSSRQY
jgi:hypothetical protein